MPDAYALLDALFAHAPVGLAFWDDELRYRRINPALAAMNGARAGGPPRPDGRGGPRARAGRRSSASSLERVAADGRSRSSTCPSRASRAAPTTGRASWMASYYPVRSADGERLGVAGLVRDVSEEAEAEAERVRLLREALSSRAQAEAAQVRAEARAGRGGGRAAPHGVPRRGRRPARRRLDRLRGDAARGRARRGADDRRLVHVHARRARRDARAASPSPRRTPSSSRLAVRMLERYPRPRRRRRRARRTRSAPARASSSASCRSRCSRRRRRTRSTSRCCAGWACAPAIVVPLKAARARRSGRSR